MQCLSPSLAATKAFYSLLHCYFCSSRKLYRIFFRIIIFIFPRLSAAIIGLTVNRSLGYNALMLLAVDKKIITPFLALNLQQESKTAIVRQFPVLFCARHLSRDSCYLEIQCCRMHTRVSCLRYNLKPST